jgi:hypothetical protein
MKDRAAVISAALIQIISPSATPQDLRMQFETLLRDEIADIKREVLADTRLPDG